MKLALNTEKINKLYQLIKFLWLILWGCVCLSIAYHFNTPFAISIYIVPIAALKSIMRLLNFQLEKALIWLIVLAISITTLYLNYIP